MPNMALVVLIGHLGRDPEMRQISSGDSVVTFSMATTRKRKEQELTTWWRCTVWGKRGQVIMQYLKKGDAIQVTGEPYQTSYEKDGQTRTMMEIEVRDFSFVGKNENKHVDHGFSVPPTQPTQAQQQVNQYYAQQQPPPPPQYAGYPQAQPFDDPIPF